MEMVAVFTILLHTRLVLSCGDKVVSNHLRQVVLKMMNEHRVRYEEGLSVPQWLEKKQHVMDPAEWGGDVD